MRALIAFVGLTLAGCLDPTPVPPAVAVCEAICACKTPLEHAQQQCATDCEAEVAGVAIPPACVTCAEQSACFELDDCLSSCFAIPAPAPEEP